MKTKAFKHFNLKHLIVLIFVMLFSISTSIFFLESNPKVQAYSAPVDEILEFDGTYDWEVTPDTQTSSTDYITYTTFRLTYCNAASTSTACATAASGKKIRFDTAEELYRFSKDVSLEEIYITGTPAEDVKLSDAKITVLLSLNYVLGKNIDYSVMQSKAFIPIGYAFTDVEENIFQRSFAGSFDGQGFEITSLYVAGYDHLVYIDYVDEVTTIDIALSEHYSMFNYNQGTIKNLGLINPNLEILELHTDITKLSNLVGFNMAAGVVQNVYVKDTRTTTTTAGMRYAVGSSSEDFQAAGIIHTNQGTFKDSYYVSMLVMNGNYINKFDVQPVLYLNSGSGSSSGLVFDDTVYLELVTVGSSTFTVDTPNLLATSETTTLLKSSSSSLTSGDVNWPWYCYPSDGYPLLQGFEYNDTDNVYEIDSAIDLAFLPRALGFISVDHGVNFAHADFVLLNDIDMSTLAPRVYTVPTVTFYGSLSGENLSATDLSDNYYIYNLNILYGILRGSEYYSGMFSILGAGSEISNLNYSQSTVGFTNTNTNYSYDFFIGAIAGKMTGGTISNILLDVDINLGVQALGTTYAGGLVGKASGVIENVSNYGDFTSGTHVWASQYSIKPVYNIGGVVGAAQLAKLTMTDVVNHGTIYGLGTTSTITLASGYTFVEIRIGGVIGYIGNSTGNINEMINIANFGDIYTSAFTYTVGVPSYQYVGGVFGKLGGIAPILESSSEYKFANFYNEGDIYNTYTAGTSYIKAAGIGINKATAAIEYALMFNHGTFDFTEGAATYTQQQFDFVSLIYDVGSYGVTISRSYNYADLSFDSNVYHDISGLYYSVNNNATLLRFVANYGDISFMSNSGASQITMSTTLNIAGITRNSNVNYLNVYNYGDIDVVNLNMGSNALYIGGLGQQLNSGKYIKNSLNDGDITFAQISGTGIILVAGLINTNLSGDLDDAGQSTTQPIATIGVINSINSGNISTSYGVVGDNLYAVDGTNNSFVGGLVTLNKGSIQSCANLGDIGIYNSNTSGVFNYETSSSYAGLVINYTAGMVAGGIVAATIGGDGRVYDTANNGDITVVTYRLARAGGVLGVSLYDEAEGGGITSGMGLVDTIEDSVLSNGLNFGNVSAITSNIGTYETGSYTLYNQALYYNGSSTYNDMNYYGITTLGTDDRPQINASAGGVIGYGLSVMQRMLNHGTISSTDTAGGIVGATYVLGNGTTVVDIATAINYGDIKAINYTSYSSVDKFDLEYDDYSTYFLADGSTYIYPTGFTSLQPAGKRGFGGIFGRLQRGTSGYMTSSGGRFDFIVNANENIDLIGRLDQVQNFTSSSRFFQFVDAIYYSAKLNDTTQEVFTGYYYASVDNVTRTGSLPYYYTSTINAIYQQIGMTYSTVAGSGGNYSYTAGNYATAPSSTNRYVYYGQIEVPWITEDPNDANITDIDNQYIYDEDFPMRSDPDLNEYIYYMPNELLAPRFVSTRPNGMYVLSTSAGQSFGSVIPKNISLSNVRMIDEDYVGFISLLTDYTAVSPVYKTALDSAIETSFDNLKQTTFNDKSEIIPDDTIFVTIEEEAGGSDTILSMPDIDYINNEITFSISMEAYDPVQTTADYDVTSALTSVAALIAERADDYYGHAPSTAELEAYNNLLYPERAASISSTYPAALSVTLPDNDITVNDTRSIGYFTVYSEAFIGDDLYASSTYYTDFQVFIEFTPALAQIAGTLQIETAAFNGGSNLTVSDPTDITAVGTVNSLGSVKLNFEDNKGVLTQGYNFKNNFVVKYNDGTIVSSSYYTVTSTPVNIVTGVGYFDITFTFIDVSKAGDYYFEYSYFPTSTKYTCDFDKGSSGNSAILDFTYYSEEDSINIVGTTITSYVNIGYVVDMDTSTTNFTTNNGTGLPSYVSNVTFDIDFMTTDSLSISPFAAITSARLVQTTITNGYKTYQMEYTVQAESGSSSVYTHYLIERSVDLTGVQKDGNDVQIGNIHAAREAASTIFAVDLGFDQSLDLYIIDPGAYSYLEVSVTGTTNDGLTTYRWEESKEGPPRKYHKITETGMSTLENLNDNWQEMTKVINAILKKRKKIS